MLRIATYNIENLDDKADDYNPSLEERVETLRASLVRADADILCLQEVHGQELPEHTSSNPQRHLSALNYLLQGTRYRDFFIAHTVTSQNIPYDKRNLVVVSRFPLGQVAQYKNDFIDKLHYRKVTAHPVEESKPVSWERPIQHVEINHPNLGRLHIINLHLKSRLASNVEGQKVNSYTWRSAAGWAEGYFLSSIKRVGQALETRQLIDHLFDQDIHAKIIICGDFNAEPGEVPVEAICGRVENTNNPALRARVLVPCSRGIPDSVRFSLYHHGQGNLLDHMLISQALIPHFRGAEIHNENLHDESLPFAFDTKYPESDHAPFVAEFAV